MSGARGDGIEPPGVGPGHDPAAIEGANQCVECHKHSGSIWESTPHFATITEMPRSDEGRAIAKRMGIKRIKSESLCLDCHATTKVVAEKTKPVSGISCESCHGAAGGWLKRHGEFSDKEEGQESATEIEARWKDAEEAGMLRPSMILEIARNCVSCHVIPDEALINTGLHSTGSDFELVAWTQGVIRHNNFYTKGKENKVASIERQRLLHIVGILAEMETVLRAVATATSGGDYAVKNAKRFARLRKRLDAVDKLTDITQVSEAMAAIKNLKMSLKNQPAIASAADQITSAVNAFAAIHDGSQLQSIDSLLAKPENYRGGSPESP